MNRQPPKVMTIIIPTCPEGVAHISRHEENVPLETVPLDDAARIVMAAVVQGHTVAKTADNQSGVSISITRQLAPNVFGIGG